MMALDAMYLRDPEPRVLTVQGLNVWPPAPGIPNIGPLRAGQVDDEYRRIATHDLSASIHSDTGIYSQGYREVLLDLATAHGEILVAIISHRRDTYCVGIWIAQ